MSQALASRFEREPSQSAEASTAGGAHTEHQAADEDEQIQLPLALDETHSLCFFGNPATW